jgi:hypothetical protein
MIIGFDTHDLANRLATHLMRSGRSEVVTVKTHGLIADDAVSAIRELRQLAAGARTLKPGVHVWMSPAHHYASLQWERAWQLFEAEARLEGQPFVEVRHSKPGPGGRTADHVHRVYLRIRVDGTAIPQSHCAPRAEKTARICEFEHGERLITGRFNRAVEARLRMEGHVQVADAMVRAGLLDARRPEATSSAERAQTERVSDISADEGKRLSYLAFVGATDADNFRQRMSKNGLTLCLGDAGKAMIVTTKGSAYRLAAAVASGAKICGAARSIKAKDVHALADQLDLPPIAAARGTLQPTAAAPTWQQVTGINRSAPMRADPPRDADGDESRQEIAAPPLVPSASQSVSDDEEPKTAMKLDRCPSVEPDQKPLSPEAISAFERFLDVLMHGNRQVDNIQENSEPSPTVPTPAAASPLPAPTQPIIQQNPNSERTPQFPTLTGRTWRSDFKADLAEVERQFGPLIRYVKAGDGSKTIELHEGTKVLAAPNGARASRATKTTVEVMISYALNRRWQNVRLSGVINHRQQEAIARLAAQRGLILVNEDLRDIIEDELRRMRASAATVPAEVVDVYDEPISPKPRR